MRIRPEFKGAIAALLTVLLLATGVWVAIGLRLRIWSYHDYDTYLSVTRGTGVGQGLWWGEIKPGDDVEKIIQQYAPHRATRFGRWVRLDWTPGGPRTNVIPLFGVCVIAKDGRLVQAVYFSDYRPDNRIFFNSMATEDEADFRAAEAALVSDLKAKRTNAPPVN